MPKVNCAVIGCTNSTYQLDKWTFKICDTHNHHPSLKETARTARNRLLCIASQVF